ncbi:beta-fructosidase-like protein [Leishmania infantum JPCM5]|uniref:Sucrose-6-phosphate hydrolase n=2 Tax=Leishmania infantum TaxID=5671 RepID=A0A6L0XNW8_LEIIN|nr:beta-fructosidase-like protein [Leishmania infantum JPCM5]CAC9489661.1 sucrose_hydrolase-like_protein [Leishmania infantum]CAM68209.1 beta-fructosidase-like protein [Leishmania infantum JPCM5]SUZ41984.1 sucrose_hydrolase-like_protein [Leishmania infantum]|eukprot:XP_001465781.1 beta-fructosidase-like protein [Leishmania infantum JPCM5]
MSSQAQQRAPAYAPRGTHAERLAAADREAAARWDSSTNCTWYPDYHLAPHTGWMNDPTGLVHFRDHYHVFYQYHPYSAEWGPMHWGHLTSEDLVHWQHEKAALAPGDACDRDGCFSGTAVVHEDRMYVFYTGHFVLEAATPSNPDAIFEQQCVAVSSDGVNFEKLGAVVRPPPGYVHFRDPKVWQQDGRWWMVCGARDVTKDLGQLLLFATEDLLKWDDTNWQVLGMTEDKNVFMWECPDYFTIGSREDMKLLLFCPQGKKASEYNYRNRFQNGYTVGQWTPGGPWRVQREFRELDRGHDFYAAQTFLAADGQRRMLMAWCNMWESPMPTKQYGWSGCLTLPRELSYNEATGQLRMLPARELVGLRTPEMMIVPTLLVENNNDAQILANCTAYELDIAFNMETSTAEKYGLWLGSGAELYVDAQSKRLVLNRHYPQHMLSGYRSCEMPTGLLLQLHVFIDRSSIEVFVNNGEATFSSRVFPDEGDRALRVFSVNGTADMVGGTMWKLKATVRH